MLEYVMLYHILSWHSTILHSIVSYGRLYHKWKHIILTRGGRRRLLICSCAGIGLWYNVHNASREVKTANEEFNTSLIWIFIGPRDGRWKTESQLQALSSPGERRRLKMSRRMGQNAAAGANGGWDLRRTRTPTPRPATPPMASPHAKNQQAKTRISESSVRGNPP